MRNKAAWLCGFFLALLILLSALAWAVYAIAGNGDLLAEKMLRYAPPERSGLPAAEYPGVGRMTADYLTGRQPVFQYTFSDGERTLVCFQAHEADHMADCRGLIRLAGTLRWGFGAAALILACLGLVPGKFRRTCAGGMLAGLGTAGVLGTAAVLWGLADFDGLFTAFHRIAFSNDGWLLDPRTDLLIRLMPTAFFTDLALRILTVVLAAALLAGLAAGLIRRGMISGRSRDRHGLQGSFPPEDGGVEKPGNGTDSGAGNQL